MGSLGFHNVGEGDDSHKLPSKLLYDYGALNHAKVPRKLRSAMRKRPRESFTPLLPIQRKKRRRRHAFNGAETSRKKSKLNMKKGHITKDEEEVVDTLNALADLFSDHHATNTNEPGADGQDSKSKSSPMIQEGLLQKPELPVRKKSATLTFAGRQSNLCLKGDKFRGLSLSSNGALSFGTQRLSVAFENTNSAAQPSVVGNSTTTDTTYPRLGPEPKKSRKRCLTHVYIARMVKELQMPDRKDGLMEEPTQLSKRDTNVANSAVYFNPVSRHSEKKSSADVQNAILLRKRLFDQHEASRTSVLTSSLKHGSDFLSVAAGGCLDASEGINRHRDSRENFKHFYGQFSRPQNDSAMFFSPSQNGYTSTFHGRNSSAAVAQQVPFPPYLSGPFSTSAAGSVRQHLESQQQKREGQYTTGHIATSYPPDWQNGGRDSAPLINYAHSISPHFQSNYQHFSAPRQEITPISSSLPFPYVNRRI